jgi:hypothetical protein
LWIRWTRREVELLEVISLREAPSTPEDGMKTFAGTL